MEDTINTRLLFLRKHLDMNVSEFAKHIGIDRSRYAKIETGSNKPALDAVEAITSRMPDLSLDWLVNGRGPVYRDGRALKDSDVRYISAVKNDLPGFTTHGPMPNDVDINGAIKERGLSSLPKDPSPAQPAMQVVGETEMEKQLKEENRVLREQIKLLNDILRTGGDLSKLGPFNSGDQDAAGPLRVSYRKTA
ncbi:helix-turn-helix transcriptional regulator [Hymenobacter sp. GOD-10R]|uniref:helix-turn-helix domain-containing protein n=1 Tax=Hymenobacter sp. GOD-10R TaxID=3093922 RepID=UPI002D795126|nr:helix-turn-helix transcriptional regulator [Hymenobacter sp. GOD-10R]WRQ26712.1 helix-turn-helix transcriptional regulator [Hymenobacter sp. GOD-10R]